MYFSQQFHLARGDGDDWFDAILDTDTKLFVDPFLIFRETPGFWSGAHDQLINHFDICFQLIAEGGCKPESVPYQKALALLRFPEPREFCLGYTDEGTDGAGGGDEYARLIADAMVAAIGRGLTNLRHFEELGVLNKGIGPDRISDLTCNILRNRFISYTKQVVERHSLPTETRRVRAASYDPARKAWQTESHALPINPNSDRPILLVPARFLRSLPVLNPDDWWDNYEAEQLRTDLNYEVMGRVTKETIVQVARQHLEDVHAWAEGKESQDAASYDFERDPKGVWGWLAAAQQFARSSPLQLDAPASDPEFVGVIELVIGKYRHFVEEQGGWKLLWNTNGTEKPEEAAQLLFKGIAQSYCEANGIVLDREVNLGRGPVDFKFSNGYQRRALLEVKKLHNSKFWNGLEGQLPSYLKSDECNLGWYIPIKYRSGGASARWEREGPTRVRAVATAKNIDLRVTMIDGQPKASASDLPAV